MHPLFTQHLTRGSIKLVHTNFCDVVVYPRWVTSIIGCIRMVYFIYFTLHPFDLITMHPIKAIWKCFIFCVVVLVQGREVCRILILVVDYKDFIGLFGSC